jgi:drug/metabolite transporter (DMT)-like permease
MLYLVVSIVCTSLIYILFRAFTNFRVAPVAAIVVNYFTAAVIGVLFSWRDLAAVADTKPWFLLFTAALGAFFFVVFNLMQRTTDLLGVSGSTIVSRMSLVIPASVSILIFGEHLNSWKAVGIALALISIYFTVYRKRIANEVNRSSSILIPILTFIGVGSIDACLKTAERNFLHSMSEVLFVAILYTFAFLGGLMTLAIRRADFSLIFQKQNLAGGILLGVINYFSIYTFVLALTKAHLEGSKLFPINSVGIVALSTILSILLFKEKITAPKAIGLILALVAIYLINHA